MIRRTAGGLQYTRQINQTILDSVYFIIPLVFFIFLAWNFSFTTVLSWAPKRIIGFGVSVMKNPLLLPNKSIRKPTLSAVGFEKLICFVATSHKAQLNLIFVFGIYVGNVLYKYITSINIFMQLGYTISNGDTTKPSRIFLHAFTTHTALCSV